MAGSLLELTPRALERIRALRERAGDARALRVSVGDPGGAAFDYALSFTRERRDDDVVEEIDGIPVFVDPDSAMRLAGATLDFVDALEGAGFSFDNPNRPALLDDPTAAAVQAVIESDINPMLAHHGGSLLLSGFEDGVAQVTFRGGCQGCSQSSATLRQGVRSLLLERTEGLEDVVDVTDHESGENPYFS